MGHAISDKVTEAVAEMYSQYPYPLCGNHSDYISTWILPHLKSSGKTFHRILDAGCGTGNISIELAKTFPDAEVIGIDITDRSIKIAKKRAQKDTPNLSIQKSNLMQYDPSLGVFDYIHCQGVIHHLSSPEKGLKNLNSYIDDRGLLFIWLYMALGRQFILETREILSLFGSDTLDYERRLELLILIQQKFQSLGSRGRLMKDPSKELLNKNLRSQNVFLLTLIKSLQFILEQGFNQFAKTVVKKTLMNDHKNTSHKSLLKKVGQVDTYLHANDIFYRFSKVYNILLENGFHFEKIVQGMSNSLEECFGLDNPITTQGKKLSLQKQYTLIELCERPSGIGIICSKGK
jgi:2-polyprenyl-3-methyl-5-hydroxy-6-metoxy-1,4-benzoquinol methylase